MSSEEQLSQQQTQGRQRGRTRTFPFRRIVTVLLSWIGLSWLVIGALLAPVLPGGWLTVLALTLLSVAPLLGLRRWFGGNGAPSALARLFVLRPFWYAMLFLPLMAIGGLLGTLVGLPFGAPGDGGRVGLAAIGTVLGLGGLAGFVGSRWLVVRRMRVQLPQLPPALAGLRIVQISDLHVGPHTSRRHLSNIAAAIQAAEPDLIAITGDQVDDYPSDVAHFATAFGKLAAPLGIYAIAGNHDIYAGWAPVRAGLERMGVRVLVNEATPLEYRGARFWLAGTGDPAGTYVQGNGGEQAAPNIAQTVAQIPEGSFSIALAHNPLLWPALAQHAVPLTLSGHTHHGQLAIPRWGWSIASPFVEHATGPYRLGGSLLYINPGTNFWGIPFRIGALPEVTVLTLEATEGEAAIVRE